jgi:hypothetical protein
MLKRFNNDVSLLFNEMEKYLYKYTELNYKISDNSYIDIENIKIIINKKDIKKSIIAIYQNFILYSNWKFKIDNFILYSKYLICTPYLNNKKYFPISIYSQAYLSDNFYISLHIPLIEKTLKELKYIYPVIYKENYKKYFIKETTEGLKFNNLWNNLKGTLKVLYLNKNKCKYMDTIDDFSISTMKYKIKLEDDSANLIIIWYNYNNIFISNDIKVYKHQKFKDLYPNYN